jgi:hypothetical protein
MNMLFVGNLVINKNDLSLHNINGYDVAISTDVYKTLDNKEDNGYLTVENIRTHNKCKILLDNLTRVY